MTIALPEIEPGTVVAGRFEIVESLGTGGFGAVYRALDLEIGEEVALKVVGPAGDQRIRREIRAARRIGHSNVVRTYDLVEDGSVRFISMEYVEGRSLETILSRRSAIPVPEALELIRQIAAGVQAAHRAGVIHCDLKPANVLIGNDGSVKMLDFGLAHLAGVEPRPETVTLVGTPEYVAPEQVDGEKISRRTDIYSLGILLYRVLTGELPFRGKTAWDTARARFLRAPENPCDRNPALPPGLGRCILKCLELRPSERFGSITEMMEAVEQAVMEDGDMPTLPLGKTPVRRTRWAVQAVAAGVVLASLLWMLPALFKPSGPRPLFEDGTVRIVVYDLEQVTPDPDTRVAAIGFSEALRARMIRNEVLKVLSVEGPASALDEEMVRALGVEQVLTGRISRLGDDLRIVLSVTGAVDRERWMMFEQQVPWSASWNGIDAIAESAYQAYAARLKIQRLAEATGK